jgi:hypothetical protein
MVGSVWQSKAAHLMAFRKDREREREREMVRERQREKDRPRYQETRYTLPSRVIMMPVIYFLQLGPTSYSVHHLSGASPDGDQAFNM